MTGMPAIAAIGLISLPLRLSTLYAALTALMVDLSLGVNGFLYRLLLAVAPFMSSLRSPARFAALVMLALAVLAAAGVSRIGRASVPSLRPFVVLVFAALCVVESWSAPIAMRPQLLVAPAVSRWLAVAAHDTVPFVIF